ncbi:MAG: hypothetical protein R3C45_13175 [Phycisphaerales bacterium]
MARLNAQSGEQPDGHLPLPFGRPLAMIGESARFASRCLGVKLGLLEPAAGRPGPDPLISATPLNADNLAGHFIFAMGPEFVSDVMVGGEWKLRGGAIVSCDEASEECGSFDRRIER